MLVVEILGATSTITYGLNIVCDPVHEPLEYEADAPGITKVRPFLQMMTPLRASHPSLMQLHMCVIRHAKARCCPQRKP